MKTQTNSFERFLLKNRVFCEVGMCMKLAVRVLSLSKNPVAVCAEHFGLKEPHKANVPATTELP